MYFILNTMIVKGRFIMKRRLALVLLVTVLGCSITACGTEDRTSDEVQTETQQNESDMVHLGGAEEVAAFIDEIYAGIEDKLPMGLMTTELDLSDMDSVAYNTGLTDVTGIDGIAVSESMAAMAYSLVYVRTNDDADPVAIQQQIMSNIDPRKWICVIADEQVSAILGKDVFFLMSSEENVDTVYGRAMDIARSKGLAVTSEIENHFELDF